VKKISIITPCRNSEQYIRETVESIIGQSALLSKRAELEYIICDGSSKDKTVSIIESYRDKSIKLISEPDSGIYEALSKGLKLASGEIVAYLNAGDYYSKHAFDIILDIFETRDVKWLTGLNVRYNEKSYLVQFSLPFKYRKRFIDKGFYGKKLAFIQQESTFWMAELIQYIDFEELSGKKYAGDYYLWKQFSKAADLAIVEAYLGGFKVHRGQVSENLEAYFKEVDSMTKRPSLYDYPLYLFDKTIWLMPGKIKKMFNRELLFRFDHISQEWV
jgi:glycosyltransferase involved in cell wall biosynthesis